MPDNDPFFITGPALISFSGGRTSAYMLYRILQSHSGVLPVDVVVAFANTGREMPATLDFIKDVGDHWNVPIIWLEYYQETLVEKTRRTRSAKIVNYNNASRNGEPFDMLLESKKIVPDRQRRFCTEELKVATIERYIRAELQWPRWQNIVGFRADEYGRIDKKRLNEKNNPKRFWSSFPLADGRIQEMDILKFWRESNFDLHLDKDGDGGNCDGCFMFSSERIGRMFQKYPDRMDWWIKMEGRFGRKTMRPGQPYSKIRKIALSQGVLDWEDGSPCDESCGV